MSRRSRRARERAAGRRPAGPGAVPPSGSGAADAAGVTAGATGAAGTRATALPAQPPPRRATGPSGTRRAGKRERPLRRYKEPFFERYRGLLLGAFLLAGVALIGYFFITSASARSYQCDSLLTPPPSAGEPAASASPTASPTAQASPSPTPSRSPAGSPSASPSASPTPTPGPDQRLGFVTEDLGRNHLTTRTNSKRYAYCPPASGPHYNAAGLGPLKRNFFGPEQEQDPGGWIHNLEHGYVVLLYSCGESGTSCPSPDEMAQLRQWFDRVPTTPGAESCKIPNKVLAARFDSMKTRFAVLAWDRALLMDKFDLDAALKFAEQWIDGPSAPEAGVC